MSMRASNLAVVIALTVFFGEAVIGCQTGSVPDPGLPEGVVPTPQRGPVTFVCVFQDSRWQFIHMSFSEYLPPTEA